METEASTIIFYILASIITIFSVMTVVSTKILRAATYLLFVLITTAGLYLLLNYHFVAAVQISIYAGGIVVLYVFGILLTTSMGDKIPRPGFRKKLLGVSAVVVGLVVTAAVIFGSRMFPGMESDIMNHVLTPQLTESEINMREVGTALLSSNRHGFVLPFEAISVLLLACVIGGVMIARKR